jgi:two-component system sensor kinase FixL
MTECHATHGAAPASPASRRLVGLAVVSLALLVLSGLLQTWAYWRTRESFNQLRHAYHSSERPPASPTSSEMPAAGRSSLAAQEQQFLERGIQAQTLAWGGSLLGLVLLSLTVAGLVRENRHRRQAEARLQEANTHLEQRVAERTAALEDRDQRLQAIVNTAVEGIVTIDPRGIVESMNPAAEKMFGYRAEEVVGHNVSRLMPEPYRSEHDTYLSRYLATGQAKIIGIGREVFGQRKDGSVFPIHLSVSEIRLGAERLFTGLIRDLTDRKRLESQAVAAAEQERGRIARDLHDGLGQQLGGALFLSSLLQRDLQERHAPEAARAAEIHRLIELALADARTISRGLYPVPPEPDGLMTALQNLADRVTRDCGIECRFDADSAVLLDDPATASHLYRLAQEAVSNAVKYSGSPRIDIRLNARAHQLELIVRDYGKGLTADTRPAGLGTQTMRHRAQELGGWFTVENAPDGGVEVRCVAPFYRTKPSAAAPAVSP